MSSTCCRHYLYWGGLASGWSLRRMQSRLPIIWGTGRMSITLRVVQRSDCGILSRRTTSRYLFNRFKCLWCCSNMNHFIWKYIVFHAVIHFSFPITKCLMRTFTRTWIRQNKASSGDAWNLKSFTSLSTVKSVGQVIT